MPLTLLIDFLVGLAIGVAAGGAILLSSFGIYKLFTEKFLK